MNRKKLVHIAYSKQPKKTWGHESIAIVGRPLCQTKGCWAGSGRACLSCLQLLKLIKPWKSSVHSLFKARVPRDHCTMLIQLGMTRPNTRNKPWSWKCGRMRAHPSEPGLILNGPVTWYMRKKSGTGRSHAGLGCLGGDTLGTLKDGGSSSHNEHFRYQTDRISTI